MNAVRSAERKLVDSEERGSGPDASSRSNESEPVRVLSDVSDHTTSRMRYFMPDSFCEFSWECNADGRCVRLTPAWETVFGYSPEEVIGHRFTEFLPPDRSVDDSHTFLDFFRGGILNGYETVLLNKSGNEVHISFCAETLRDESGRTIGTRGTARITDSRRNVEHDYRILFRQMTDGVALFEVQTDDRDCPVDYRFLTVNPAFERLFGCFASAIVGRSAQGVIRDFDTVWLDVLNRVVATAEPGNFEWHESELEKHFQVTAFRPCPQYCACVLRDVTDQKKMEDALLKNQRLESLGLLASGIAHDFNNLLSGIFGYVDMAREYLRLGKPEKAAVDLVSAMGVFERARCLTRQLLTFSRGGDPDCREGDIVKTLRETVPFALSGSNVRAEFSVPESLWTCEYDEDQIRQVVESLVINAKQAMPDGGALDVYAKNIRIRANSELGLKPGRYVVIRFRDHGAGISEESLPKVFDPFYTTKASGSGLGLTTSWSIIRKHGGLLQAESMPGNGSTFSIYLPACEPKEKTGAVTKPPVVAKATHRKTAGEGGSRILLMDDEDFIRTCGEEMLRILGHSVVVASVGEEALALFLEAKSSEDPFDLAILDLTVPGGMGGKETIAAILRIDPGFKAIASSGYSGDPIIAKPESFGFTASLRKPYQMEELKNVVNQALKAVSSAP